MHQPTASPDAAYDACYLTGTQAGSEATAADLGQDLAAELVLMDALVAGDRVLTSTMEGALAITRVVVVQHDRAALLAPVTTMHTTGGSSLSLTSTHALYIDGKLLSAAEAKVGTTLTTATGEAVRIKRVTTPDEFVEVINPVTAAGTLLASDEGQPLLAASHPIWIAPTVVEGSALDRALVNAAIAYVGDVSSIGAGVAYGGAKLVTTLAVIGFTVAALRRVRKSA